MTTASLEAFRAYSLGMEQLTTDTNPEKTIPLFQHAVDLDPQFAMAWQLLATMFAGRGDGQRAEEYFRKAFSLSAYASEREKLEISANYQLNVLLDLDKAKQTLEVYRQTYPRSSAALTSLAQIDIVKGDVVKAIEYARDAIDLDPRVSFYKSNLAFVYTRAGRSDEARNVLRNLAEGQVSSGSRALMLYIAAMTGDHASEAAETDWFSHNPDDDWATILGSVDIATGLIRQAGDLLKRPTVFANIAELYAVVGDCERARNYALRSLNPNQVPDDAFPADLALALCGGGNVAKLAGEMSSRYPSATLWNDVYLPVIRAAQAIQIGQPANAIDILPISTSYEKAYPEIGYLRALANLRLRKGSEAAVEFRKIIDGKGTYFFQEVYYSAALVGLARAETLSGDPAKAKKTYEDFFALWKDADPDVPPPRRRKEGIRGIFPAPVRTAAVPQITNRDPN